MNSPYVPHSPYTYQDTLSPIPYMVPYTLQNTLYPTKHPIPNKTCYIDIYQQVQYLQPMPH